MKKTLKLVRNLPVSYARQIGLIVTHWAYVEWRLRQIAYHLLGLSAPEGRIVVREPRAPDYVDMIMEIMAVKQLTTTVPLPQLREALRSQESERNLLAHGLWARHPITRQLGPVDNKGIPLGLDL